MNSLLLSNIASKELLGYIDRNKEKMNDGETFGIDYPLELNIDEQTKKDTNISKIYIDLYFRNTAIAKSNAERKENITGKFIPKKTKINEDGSIDAYISIGVYQNDYTKNVDLIKSIVAHEIVHALKYAKTFNKKNRSRILNKVRGEVLPTISKVNNEYIEEFLKMFYLSLQDEIQAKVQEVGVYLQSLKSLSTEEIINKVSTLKFTTDAVKMKNYKPNKILSMDNETIKSENIDMVKIKTPSDPKLFLIIGQKL